MGETKKAVVATFVLGGMLIFAVGLFMIGDRRRLFEDSLEVSARFNRLAGLQEGAPVRIAGVEAGEVLEIRYPDAPGSPFVVRMRIIEALRPMLRQDSEASVRTDGLVGNKLIHITSGTESSPTIPDGGQIQGRDPLELADLLDHASDAIGTFETSLRAIRGDAEQAIASVQNTVKRAEQLVVNVEDDFEAVSTAAADIAVDARHIVAEVRAGKGTIGKLVNDDAIYDRARNAAANVEAMTADAAAVTENVKELSQSAKDAFVDMRSEHGVSSGLMTDVKATVASAQEAMSDMAESMESLKRNFLFRSMFQERGYFDLDEMGQEEYTDGVLAKDHRALRIWLDASELFEAGAGGEEILRPSGKAAIDAAMIDILREPQSAPLMVEGYSNVGSLDRQFLTARRRAFLVREYIVRRYHRNPNHTSFIALETMAASPELADGPTEEGVVLSLFYEGDEDDAPRHRLFR